MKNFMELEKRTSKEFPRKFLKDTDDVSKRETVVKYTEALLKPNPQELPALMGLLERYIEFSNVTLEEYSRLYIRTTMNTLVKSHEKKFLHFAEKIEPVLEVFNNKFQKKINAHPLKKKLPPAVYGRWLKSVEGQLKLFHKKNIPLNIQLTKTVSDYQRLSGKMSVKWRGKNRTLAEMSMVLEDPDRNIREEAWRLTAKRRLQDKSEIEKNYQKLFSLRKKIAANLGLKNYREFAFKNYERTDYNTKHCQTFHKMVKETVLPLYKKILKERAQKLGVSKLRPWDLSCDIYGGAALKPFQSTSTLVKNTGAIFQKMDKELFDIFKVMKNKKLLDLENRSGKAPGGYQCTLDEARLPFIFMNSVGGQSDVMTLLHESGHAFHMYLSREQDLPFNREAPMEFCEVASMSMELFGQDYLSQYYKPRDLNRAVLGEKEEVFRLLVWVAIIDKFQHWIYTHPNHQAKQRRDYWLKLNKEFDTGIDWTGLKETKEILWHKQLHLFEVPFYYIEYGIAQLGALQFWHQYKKNKAKTLKNYKAILKKGGTLGLKDLFETAGLKFDFSSKTVKPMMQLLYNDWQKLHKTLS